MMSAIIAGIREPITEDMLKFPVVIQIVTIGGRESRFMIVKPSSGETAARPMNTLPSTLLRLIGSR